MSPIGIIAAAITTLVVVVSIVVVAGYWRTSHAIRVDVDRLLASARPMPSAITDETLATLPPPAKRYFRHAGVVGKPIPRIVRLAQRGRIRSSGEANWMALEADETYSTSPPAFVWQAFLPSRVTPIALGRDEYLGGQGSILIRLLGLVPVADEHGDELKAAGLMRYLNEAMWFPAALLGPNAVITAVDETSFRVTLSDRGDTAEALFIVDADGRLVNFRAQRYNTGTRSIETWETPVGGYRDFDGLSLPSTGSAVWKLATGDLTYIELEISSITYEY